MYVLFLCFIIIVIIEEINSKAKYCPIDIVFMYANAFPFYYSHSFCCCCCCLFDGIHTRWSLLLRILILLSTFYIYLYSPILYIDAIIIISFISWVESICLLVPWLCVCVRALLFIISFDIHITTAVLFASF